MNRINARLPILLSMAVCLANVACEGSSTSSATASATAKASKKDVLAAITGSGITLESVFKADQAPLAAALKSKQHAKTGKWLTVPAKFTAAGWTALHKSSAIDDAYQAAYVKAWQAFVADIDVVQATSHADSLKLLDVHTKTPFPLALVLKTIKTNTVNLPGATPTDPVVKEFVSLTRLIDGGKQSVMSKWAEIAKTARGEIATAQDKQLRLDLKPTVKEITDLLESYGDETKKTAGAWFLAPLFNKAP